VTGVRLDGNEVELSFIDAGDSKRTRRSSQIVFALPPRLLEATVSFTPSIEEEMAQRLRDTPTWMAPHAKFFAVYERPFWRDKGLSGTAQSAVGPLSEIHDATTASGHAALFGFLGLSAEQRHSMGDDEIIGSCVEQLTVLFGSEAGQPRATLFKDWAIDPFTATIRDRTSIDHPIADRRPWIGEPWRDHILLAGSETSTREPGYLAGAVDAAERAAAALISRMKDSPAVSPGEPSKHDNQKAVI
jgi:monoamine oxidase